MPNPLVEIFIPYALSDLQKQALHVWLASISSTLERRRPFARRNQRHHDHIRDQRELLMLRLQLWAEENHDPKLQEELYSLQAIVRESVHHYWHIGVTDGQQLDVAFPITNAVRPFSVDLQAFEPENWDENNASTLELCELITKIGAVPKYRIQLLGFLESPDDYLLCGYMAADLAQQYDAYTKVLLRPKFYTARGAADWSKYDTERLASSLGGVSHEIHFSSKQSDMDNSYHLLDGYAMREWTKHARFHLHF